jgi:ribosome-binding factor A
MARVNDTIRRELSELLMRETRDPRLEGLLSITAVDTSPDLKYARVYVSVMGAEEDKERVQEGLAAATGFLRRGLAARLTMRYIPELAFERDDSIERGTRLLEMIKEIAPDTGTDETD